MGINDKLWSWRHHLPPSQPSTFCNTNPADNKDGKKGEQLSAAGLTGPIRRARSPKANLITYPSCHSAGSKLRSEIKELDEILVGHTLMHCLISNNCHSITAKQIIPASVQAWKRFLRKIGPIGYSTLPQCASNFSRLTALYGDPEAGSPSGLHAQKFLILTVVMRYTQLFLQMYLICYPFCVIPQFIIVIECVYYTQLALLNTLSLAARFADMDLWSTSSCYDSCQPPFKVVVTHKWLQVNSQRRMWGSWFCSYF